jgi:caa(3)-type oxidase subunit IV
MSEFHHPNYVRIWAILVVLLCISVAGPFFGHPVVTLITAFGIAVVKAYLVARNFMHLNVEKRLALYMLSTVLVFVFLFFAGVAPDVMRHDGWQWEKPLPKAMAAEYLAREASSGAPH